MISLEEAIQQIANGVRICPRCQKSICVDQQELNIHNCLPAPELDQGRLLIVIGSSPVAGGASVIAGRRDNNVQKAVRLMREKYHLHEIPGWVIIQVLVP